jgi:hypothetical protein
MELLKSTMRSYVRRAKLGRATLQANLYLDSGLIEDARREAELLHRSLSGQIEHWARLGRAIENAEGVSIARVHAALEGRLKIDEFSEPEQDAFFAELGSVFEAPSSEISQAYAERGQQRRTAQAARRAPRSRGAA